MSNSGKFSSGNRVRPTPGARPDRSYRVLGFHTRGHPPTPKAKEKTEQPQRSRLREFLHAVNKRLGSPYAQIRSTLFKADLSDPLPDFEPDLSVSVRPASPEDASVLGRLRFPENQQQAAAKAREFAERLARGDSCLIASAGDRPVSYVWVTTRDWWDPELEFTIPVGDDQCLGYEAYTDPEFRRQGLRQLLQIEERRHGRDLGKKDLLFELHGKDAPLAIEKWEPVGLKQHPVATHVTYKLFKKFKFTKVKNQNGKTGSSKG